MTDMWMGSVRTYATKQTNMIGRKIPMWIFQLEEIISLFKNNGYSLIYRSTNYQPFHHFNNFPVEYQIKDSCNLLFEKLDQ